jgi:hypothetical protein
MVISIYKDKMVADNSLRGFIRARALDSVAIAQRFTGMRRHLERGRVHILCLHTIYSDEIEPFRQMLAALSQRFTFTTFSDAIQRIENGDLDQPYLAFTFDDGMRNNLRAAEILEDFGVRGMFYVCPSIVGERDPAKVTAFCRERLQGPVVEFLDWTDLEQLFRRGHEIGSHTSSHLRLNELHQDIVYEELTNSRRRLIDAFGHCSHFAWPYGLMSDVPDNIGKLSLAAGYNTCASAVRGCHVIQASTLPDQFCVRRENVQATWPIQHILSLLCRSSACADSNDNYWPGSQL